MAKNDYRTSKAQVNVVLDHELRDRMRRKAQRNHRTLSDEFRLASLAWLGEDVEHGGGSPASRAGRSAEADGGWNGHVPGRDGDDPPRVDPGHGPDSVDVFDRLFAEQEGSLIGATEPSLPFDPFADDTLPAQRDSRGRLPSPIVRDEHIDIA